MQDSPLTPSSGELEWKSTGQLSLVHAADSAKSVFVRVVNAAGGVVWQSPAGVAVTIMTAPSTV